MKDLILVEEFRQNSLLQYECKFGHKVYSTPEQVDQGRKCAYCNGHDALNAYRTIKASGFTVKPGTTMYTSGGQKMLVLVDELGRGRPTPVNDLSNGIYPGLVLPESKGMYLYYMKVNGFWKIGVSRNPYVRLADLGPELIWAHWYTREVTARLEEAAIKEKYKEFRNRDRMALGGRGGWTELFTKDIFNG